MSDRSRGRSRIAVRPALVAGKTARRATAANLAPALRPAPETALDGDVGPIVKWVGGKTRLLPALLSRLPATYGRYFEPFAGGAALFFRLRPRAAVLNDFNADLVATYRAVARDADAVIRRLDVHRRHHAEAHYYDVRARWNDRAVSWSAVDRAAAFIYLNKTCFNGLWRVNRGGAFNVPMGRYVDPPICVPDALRAASRVLARADLRTGDYRAAVADAAAGDLVYFDPPYDPVSTTASFTSYTKAAFGPDQQRELAELARGLVARGCKVVLSNSDTPFVRSLYKGFRVDRVQCARAINCNAAKRGDVDEVIVMGGY
jgi:DNA adenine methylase